VEGSFLDVYSFLLISMAQSKQEKPRSSQSEWSRLFSVTGVCFMGAYGAK